MFRADISVQIDCVDSKNKSANVMSMKSKNRNETITWITAIINMLARNSTFHRRYNQFPYKSLLLRRLNIAVIASTLIDNDVKEEFCSFNFSINLIDFIILNRPRFSSTTQKPTKLKTLSRMSINSTFPQKRSR